MLGREASLEVKKIDKSDFRARVLHTFAQTQEFGHLVNAGAADLSRDERTKLCSLIENCGFYFTHIDPSDKELDTFAEAVTTRSSTLT